MGCGAELYTTGDLPEDILWQCVSGEHYLCTAGYGQVLCYLEDPNVLVIALEGDIIGDQETGTPFVDARFESQSADVSGGCEMGGKPKRDYKRLGANQLVGRSEIGQTISGSRFEDLGVRSKQCVCFVR